LNTIFNELEKRKCKIIVERTDNYLRGYPSANMDGIVIHFDLRELTTKKTIEVVKNSWDNRTEFIFNGRLEFRLHGYYLDNLRKIFTDGPRHKIEEYISEIINNLMLGFENGKEYRITQTERRKEEERIRIIKEAEKKKVLEENRKFGLLQEMSTQLNTFSAINRLVSQIRLKYEKEISSNIKLCEWLNWAEQANTNNNPIDTLGFLGKFEEQKNIYPW
jgi:hypothetical protein